jgi:hypothetical protein
MVVADAVTCAAVLGRPGEAEALAAALALELRRRTRARAATVIVVESEPQAPLAASGTRAARRLAARLAAHGVEAVARGMLAWARLTPAEPLAVRRGALVGAPAVLAVTAPLTAALEEAIAEQDLAVLVTADPEGPLAELALADASLPVVTAKPLARGPGRSLSRAGLLAARPARDLVRGE